MSFGSRAPSTPAAQPVTRVPQEDDPDSIEHRRRAAQRASEQDGISAHLLTSENGVEEGKEKNDLPRMMRTY